MLARVRRPQRRPAPAPRPKHGGRGEGAGRPSQPTRTLGEPFAEAAGAWQEPLREVAQTLSSKDKLAECALGIPDVIPKAAKQSPATQPMVKEADAQAVTLVKLVCGLLRARSASMFAHSGCYPLRMALLLGGKDAVSQLAAFSLVP